MQLAKQDLYLGLAGEETLLSAFGRTFTERDEEISRTDRTASGRLVRDIVSVKKRFTLDYESITGTDLATIESIYGIGGELSLMVYRTASTYDRYTVLMEPIERERIITLDDGLYGGVVVELSEV